MQTKTENLAGTRSMHLNSLYAGLQNGRHEKVDCINLKMSILGNDFEKIIVLETNRLPHVFVPGSLQLYNDTARSVSQIK